jgi:hypothetical protein
MVLATFVAIAAAAPAAPAAGLHRAAARRSATLHPISRRHGTPERRS